MRPAYAPITLGERIVDRRFDWFHATEARYAPNTDLPRHVHRHPALTVVCAGAYELRQGGRLQLCDTGTVQFELGGRAHRTRILEEGFRAVILEVHDDLDGSLPTEDLAACDPWTMHLAARVRAEMRAADAASKLVLEGLTLELLGALRRAESTRGRTRRPVALETAVDYIRSHLGENLRLAVIAAAVGQRPSFLAQLFRRHLGCSVGGYLRRVRLERASERLREGDSTIGAIAQEFGFYDQPHFVRSFKAVFGVTPRDYREAWRGPRR